MTIDFSKIKDFPCSGFLHLFLLTLIMACLSGCNKDDVIEDNTGHAPEITLDSESGVYTVKIGRQLTIAPDVRYADNAVYSWICGNEVIGRDKQLTVCYDAPCQVYVTFRVETPCGSAEEEIRIDALEKTPPLISLALPSEGLRLLPDTEYTFTPDIQHDDEPGFSIEWTINGNVVSQTPACTFRESETGVYHVSIKASNDDGSSVKDFDVEVVSELPAEVSFPTPSYFQNTTDRNTVVGRPLFLTPILEYISNPVFTWCVDGIEQTSATGRTFKFTPAAEGTYTVSVSVASGVPGNIKRLTRNVARGETRISATVIVHCFANEEAFMRHAGSKAIADRVFEFLPAPGQFVNDMENSGYYAGITSEKAAAEYALGRLNNDKYVSLGGWGGYIIVGFDHSVRNSGGYDFSICGNAFESTSGSSNEPGIVWVMQDTNGNGLPDDEWYELRGSETGKESTIQDYCITYYRPGGPKMGVLWTDSRGNSGKIAYFNYRRAGDTQYPLWIKKDSFTLRGTLLKSNNTYNPSTGFWINNALGWGYADNAGSDLLEGNQTTGGNQATGFKISNAMHSDGTPVNLKFIDFIKVQTGVNAQSGALGEISCEVFAFRDLTTTKR